MPYQRGVHRVPVAISLAGVAVAVALVYWLGGHRAATRRARARQGALRSVGRPSAFRKLDIEVPADDLLSQEVPVVVGEALGRPSDTVAEPTLRGAKI